MPMGVFRFYGRALALAFTRTPGLAQDILFVVFVVAGAILYILKRLGMIADTSSWMSQVTGWQITAAVAVTIIAIRLLLAPYWLYREQAEKLRQSKPDELQAGRPPQIEIHFEKRAPYEASSIENRHVLSAVRIGIKNAGGGALSNCRASIEKIAPEAPISLPMRLRGEGFRLRHDDTEELVTIAERYDHVDKYRFAVPLMGGFWDSASIGYLDAATVRTIVVKILATECERSATFKIWSDESKAVHLEFLGYVS